MSDIIRISLALFIISFCVPKRDIIKKVLSTKIFLNYGETKFAVMFANGSSIALFFLVSIYAGIDILKLFMNL